MSDKPKREIIEMPTANRDTPEFPEGTTFVKMESDGYHWTISAYEDLLAACQAALEWAELDRIQRDRKFTWNWIKPMEKAVEKATGEPWTPPEGGGG